MIMQFYDQDMAMKNLVPCDVYCTRVGGIDKALALQNEEGDPWGDASNPRGCDAHSETRPIARVFV